MLDWEGDQEAEGDEPSNVQRDVVGEMDPPLGVALVGLSRRGCCDAGGRCCSRS
jgi:hypothetical protein